MLKGQARAFAVRKSIWRPEENARVPGNAGAGGLLLLEESGKRRLNPETTTNAQSLFRLQQRGRTEKNRLTAEPLGLALVGCLVS
jgi:hypothetical protein